MRVALYMTPCLDVRNGRMVKGVNFRGLKDAGDPAELATRYGAEGTDELTFLDISVSAQGRETTREMMTRCAGTAFIPLTVGGGVQSVADVNALLRYGTGRASINTGTLADPGVIDKIATRFSSQVLVPSLDTRCADRAPSGFEVTTHGECRPAGWDAIGWAREAVDRDVGEVLLNPMDADGTIDGFDTGMVRAVRAIVDVPLIASGEAGTTAHFVETVRAGTNAVLAVSIFHYGRLTIVGVGRKPVRAGSEVRGV